MNYSVGIKKVFRESSSDGQSTYQPKSILTVKGVASLRFSCQWFGMSGF
jgi:hypothetical protein